MNRLAATAAMVLTALVAACAVPLDGPPEMRMMPANTLGGSGDIILTIPLAERPSLMAASADIEQAYGVRTVAEWPLKSIDAHCLIVRDAKGQPAQDIVQRMERDGAVLMAQTFRRFQTMAGVTYQDDLFPLQAGLQEIKAPQAHLRATGKGIRIAVIDTKIDFSHPDLASRKEQSRNLVDRAGDEASAEEHGTAIAGVIAADGSNGQGIVGVAPDARLIGLRGCWHDQAEGGGRCNSFSLARALNLAILSEVDIVNMSLAGPFDPLISDLIETALQRGITLVAAEATDAAASFPANQEGVISVQIPSARSNADLVAPGTDIISTALDGDFDFFSGSSVAAAHVTGVAALLLEERPGLWPEELRQAIRQFAGDGTAVEELDACSAVAAVTPSAERPTCR